MSIKKINPYRRKHFLKKLQKNNNSGDVLEITPEEVQALISLLFKLGIQGDMQRRGITKFEEYADVLLKEYSLPNP